MHNTIYIKTELNNKNQIIINVKPRGIVFSNSYRILILTLTSVDSPTPSFQVTTKLLNLKRFSPSHPKMFKAHLHHRPNSSKDLMSKLISPIFSNMQITQQLCSLLFSSKALLSFYFLYWISSECLRL